MNERERLAELIAECINIRECSFSDDKRPTCEELADYLLSKGVICPPCKVGDIIYALTYDRKDYVQIKITSRQTITRWMDEDQFGNELFTTREAAQAALKERRLQHEE